ncbi:hypothetical protein N7G274_007804 [Stereocaulon virgatum]|uniref:Uncharacterized protein n=1 Tax=Stereocaulon virgatum TaxID=373712 RepID=A0ABR4A0S2_9LECA
MKAEENIEPAQIAKTSSVQEQKHLISSHLTPPSLSLIPLDFFSPPLAIWEVPGNPPGTHTRSLISHAEKCSLTMEVDILLASHHTCRTPQLCSKPTCMQPLDLHNLIPWKKKKERLTLRQYHQTYSLQCT